MEIWASCEVSSFNVSARNMSGVSAAWKAIVLVHFFSLSEIFWLWSRKKNPLKGWTGYAPTARAMAAALPHLDHLAAANTLADLAALDRELARI